MKKYFLLLGAVIILAIVGRAYWAYLQANKDENNAQKINTVLDQVGTTTLSQTEIPAEWKTYTNDQYGFEIQYPPKWGVEIDSTSGDLNIVDKSQLNKAYGTFRLVLTISPKKADSIESWFEKNIAPSYNEANITPAYKNITINGIDARELPTTISEGGCDRSVALYSNKVVFQISRNSGTCDYDENTINSVFSSFKFIR